MKINVIGPFQVNYPFATEIAFSKGLRANGHDVIEFDPNIHDPDTLDRCADFTLVFKTAISYNEVLRDLPNVVLYQPDDLDFPHIKDMVAEMRRYSPHLLLFRKLDGRRDIENLRFLDSLEFKSVGFLPLTADPDIYYPEEVEKDVDFCFIGSMGDPTCHSQRHTMIHLLRNEGFTVLSGETKDVNMIRNSYCRSRVVLNHAADRSGRFGIGKGYQCRHFEVGLTRSCLLSNWIEGEYDDNNPLLMSFVRFGPTSFINTAKYLISVDGELERKRCADRLYSEVITHHSPQVRAAELIEKVEAIL